MREALWDFCQAMELVGRFYSFDALAHHAEDPPDNCTNNMCQRGTWAFFDWCRS